MQDSSLVGVVSWGQGCGSSTFPGVYARVSSAYDWIKDNVCKNSRYKPDWCDSEGGSPSNYSPGHYEPSAPSQSTGRGSGSHRTIEGCEVYKKRGKCMRADIGCTWDGNICHRERGGVPDDDQSSDTNDQSSGTNDREACSGPIYSRSEKACKKAERGCQWNNGECRDGLVKEPKERVQVWM